MPEVRAILDHWLRRLVSDPSAALPAFVPGGSAVSGSCLAGIARGPWEAVGEGHRRLPRLLELS